MKKLVSIEWKTFDIESVLVGRTSVISITERGRDYVENIKICPSSCENLKLAARLPEVDRLIRTKDEGEKLVVIQRKSNNKGRFVEISVNPRSSRGRRIMLRRR